MTITATELKENLSKYFDIAQKEDVIVTKNGEAIVSMINPHKDKIKIANSLYGLLEGCEIDYEKERYERILNK